jgi:spermidine/putrescine transport system substrate-binding protein
VTATASTGGSMSDAGHLPPDLLRGLTAPRLSRRRALQLGGLSALGLALTACSIPGAKGSKLGLNAARQEIKNFWLAQQKTGTMRFANWPLYIDVAPKNDNDHPSLDLFKQQTGIKVTYTEAIQDNASFFGKVQPQLAAGQDIGYDLMVLTNGLYVDKLIELDYLTPLDQTRMANFYANASDLVKDPSFDRGNVYTMAWQSGITGIGYDPKRVGRELTSWEDLQDPALKGKIGMFADNEDLPNAALCAVGVNPESSTEADWKKASDWLKRQRPLVRKYYDQGYADALAKGDIWASMAYSGDIFIANSSGANLKFVVPKEGAAIWTDNMCIPAHAKHPLDAMLYMDWVYRPTVAAMLAEYIDYITPVPASAQVMLDEASKLSGSDKTDLEALVTDPLIFPKPADYAKLHRFRVLSPDELKTWNALFEPIYQS